MATSIFSTTTRGGCTFDELCNGSVRSYACDNLIDITRTRTEEAVKMLLEHVDKCVDDIETGRDCKVEHFYIGKSHVRKRARRTFNHMNRTTWKLDKGINSRFAAHSRTDYGRDGLVVLTVVTKEAIDPDIRRNKPKFHQEDYALILESRLIQEYMRTDSRLANDTVATGRRDQTASIGYPLYLAFKVED